MRGPTEREQERAQRVDQRRRKHDVGRARKWLVELQWSFGADPPVGETDEQRATAFTVGTFQRVRRCPQGAGSRWRDVKRKGGWSA